MSKLPNVGTTIFTEMSALSVKHQSINLGQGFPDFEMNEKLISLTTDAMRQGHNQYTHMNGLLALRQQIAHKVNELYHNTISADEEITITPGGTYALYTALTAILQPGDEVILFEPAYDSYIPNIEINGAVAVPLPLSFPGYRIDWNLVKSSVNKKTKAIIINSPHNPSGMLLQKEDINALVEIVQRLNLFIVSDEVYEHLVFDGHTHLSMLQFPELYARSFVCFSFGKVYHCTGWKMGYCISPAAFMNEFRKVHQFNCFSCNSPVQYALANFLADKNQYLHLGAFLQQKRDYFFHLMKDTRFKALPALGSYFQLYSYAEISNKNEKDFAIELTESYGVTAIPVSAFYQTPVNNKVLRFCFAKNESTLLAAASRLQNV